MMLMLPTMLLQTRRCSSANGLGERKEVEEARYGHSRDSSFREALLAFSYVGFTSFSPSPFGC